MASQPLNSTISVHRRVRSQLDLPLHRATFEASSGAGGNPQVMVQPGEEVSVTATRDSATGVVTTSLLTGRDSGLPVVRYAKASPTFANAVTNLAAATFKIVRVGQDAFIENTTGSVTSDLHQSVRDLA